MTVVERDEAGRKWAHAYLLKPPARLPRREAGAGAPHCLVHDGVALKRILGGAWFCPTCARTGSG